MENLEKNKENIESEEKQKRIERLQELRTRELEHLRTLDDIDVDEFEKQAQPIKYRLEDDRGIFVVEEGEDGYVDMKIESKGGDMVDLKKFLPKDHDIAGRQLVMYDTETYGMGAYHTGSYYEDEQKEVIINEKEMQQEGWKYVWTLLHEIGHAVAEEENSQLAAQNFRSWPREAMIFNEFVKDANTDSYLEYENKIAENEAGACYAGLKLFKRMLEEHPFLKDVFKDEEEDIDEYYSNLLLNKAKYLSSRIDEAAQDEKNIHITKENKEEIKSKIFEMYEYKPDGK